MTSSATSRSLASAALDLQHLVVGYRGLVRGERLGGQVELASCRQYVQHGPKTAEAELGSAWGDSPRLSRTRLRQAS